MQHAIFKALFNQRNWFAPLKRPKRVLDIGCGTGKWCIEMGMSRRVPAHALLTSDSQRIPKMSGTSDETGVWCRADTAACRLKESTYLQFSQQCKRQARVGNKLDADSSSTPDNVDFFIDDIRRREWWKSAQPYDYIHTRMSLGIFPDFREIIQKGFNNLEPGGWMESQELYPKVCCDDGTMPDDYKLLEWSKIQDDAAMHLGMPLRIANKLKRWYEQAGFVDVREDVYRIPINSWPRDARFKLLGKFMQWNMCDGVHAWTVEYFVKALDWTLKEVEVYLAHLRNSISDKNVHAYYRV
jgi:trans-aconitate methyltransferase